MHFLYSAMNACGQEVNSHVDAPSQQEAIKHIRMQGLFPTSLREDKSREDKSREDKSPRVILDKRYHGFESWSDIERDVSESWSSDCNSKVPAEGDGTISVVITYTPKAAR